MILNLIYCTVYCLLLSTLSASEYTVLSYKLEQSYKKHPFLESFTCSAARPFLATCHCRKSPSWHLGK